MRRRRQKAARQRAALAVYERRLTAAAFQQWRWVQHNRAVLRRVFGTAVELWQEEVGVWGDHLLSETRRLQQHARLPGNMLYCLDAPTPAPTARVLNPAIVALLRWVYACTSATTSACRPLGAPGSWRCWRRRRCGSRPSCGTRRQLSGGQAPHYGRRSQLVLHASLACA